MKEAAFGPADMMKENPAHPVSEETHPPYNPQVETPSGGLWVLQPG